MDPAYAAAYSELAAGHWWWQAREQMLMAEIRRLRRGAIAGRILDVGCGDGRLFPMLQQFGEVEGIEPDPATLGSASHPERKIHHIPFAEPLPALGKFNLLLMLDVLEHLDDPVESLRVAASLLVPGGALLLTVPALPALWTHHDSINHHRIRYTPNELTRQIRLAGFGVPQIRFEFHALAVAKLGVRLLESLRGGRPEVPSIPSAPINAIARGFFVLESAVTRPVARWLPGSSLVAIASLP